MIAVICVHLCSSAVNNEIEIIPACFLSANALSVGWDGGVCDGLGFCWVLPVEHMSVEI